MMASQIKSSRKLELLTFPNYFIISSMSVKEPSVNIRFVAFYFDVRNARREVLPQAFLSQTILFVDRITIYASLQ